MLLPHTPLITRPEGGTVGLRSHGTVICPGAQDGIRSVEKPYALTVTLLSTLVRGTSGLWPQPAHMRRLPPDPIRAAGYKSVAIAI